MLVSVLKILFEILAFILVGIITYGKFFVFKKREPQFISDYCAAIGVVMCGFSILALVLACISPSNTDKLVMFFLAISPFILGLITTYNTEKYFTWVQIMLFVLGIIFVNFKY